MWKFGIKQINPLTSGNEVKREHWVDMCSDCHEADWSRQQLAGLDTERKQAWKKLYSAEAVLKELRSQDLLYPAAGERPAYPADWLDSIWPRARVGFFEGQASAFYNVSPIERDYFEMWYFDNLGAYKGAAHGDQDAVTRGHAAMEHSLAAIEKEAERLRDLANQEQLEQRPDPSELWMSGDYTEFNREQN